MTDEDSRLVREMFRTLSTDLRDARAEAKRDHNAQIAAQTRLDAKVTEALRRQDVHDSWHGRNDAEIARRLGIIEAADHDEEVAEGAVKGYKKRFAWVTDLGLDAVKAAALTAVGSLLVGVGWLVGQIF